MPTITMFPSKISSLKLHSKNLDQTRASASITTRHLVSSVEQLISAISALKESCTGGDWAAILLKLEVIETESMVLSSKHHIAMLFTLSLHSSPVNDDNACSVTGKL